MGLIRNELATNTIKHAIKGRLRGQLVVKTRVESGMAMVVVKTVAEVFERARS